MKSMASVDHSAGERRARDRLDRAVETLAVLGNPGLQSRRVPGRYRDSISRRLLGMSRAVVHVSVEPAWPVGLFQWEHRHRGYKEFETGYTMSARVVPMHWATVDDDVDDALRLLRLGKEPSYAGKGRPLRTQDITSALERLVARCQGRYAS